MTTDTPTRMLTTSEVQVAIPISGPALRDAIRKRIIVPTRAGRSGRFSLFRESDLDAIRAALGRAGLLPAGMIDVPLVQELATVPTL